MAAMQTDVPYQIDQFDSHLQVTFDVGTMVTPEMIASVLEKEFNLPKESVVCDIWDFSGCTAARTIDAKVMIQIVDYIRERYHPSLKHTKTAIIVDKEVAFGLTRMFQILGEDLPYDVEIFRNLHDARQWIQA
jgi:hypothetical protein